MSGRVTCDTSVLVAALAAWHPWHDEAASVLAARVLGLPAHVMIETYSVLTRLPARHRVTPAIAGQALAALRHDVLDLPGAAHRDLVATLSRAGVRGGAVYDALVAATAQHHGLALVTADRRARRVYELVGVDIAPL